MLGDRVHAEKAQALALATELVDDAELDDATTQRLARRLTDGPTRAYAAAEALLTRELDVSLSAGWRPRNSSMSCS